ncbi:MAG TPA: L-arabinose ABC transporter permease AraH [Opitutaceae bacterium]|nr:L-arabinose ABC transporter permease AraH [Opitutaceae bacterium]
MSETNFTSPARHPTTIGAFLDRAGMLLVLALLFVGCSLFVENFFSWANMRGLALAVSMTGMVSCTMLFCLAAGDFDLSVGSVVACAGVIAAVVMNRTASIAAGVGTAIAFGAAVGAFNGVVVAKLRINALITTLATMQIVRGLAFIASGGIAVGITRDGFFALGNSAFPALPGTDIQGVPTPVWIMLACFLVFGLVLNRTVFGRDTLAVGGNAEAAHLAGIAVDRVKIVIFTVQGAMAAFAGVVLASRVTSGQPNTSQGFELEVISACVLGGVSLTGGVGSMAFVIAGVLIMGIVQNAMSLLNVPTFYQYVARGSILLAAVLFDRWKRRKQID